MTYQNNQCTLQIKKDKQNLNGKNMSQRLENVIVKKKDNQMLKNI